MTEMYNLTVDFFVNGGLFIWPIAIVFAIGLAITNERWRFLIKERDVNGKAFQDFLPLLRTADAEKMHNFSRDNDAAVVRIIGCGLDMMKVSNQRADIEHAMSEGMLEIMPKIEDRASYLSMLANVATLLGLLGTIIGLIGAFTAVANADPSEKAQLLSESISVAMNTTAFGLIAAIPLLILNSLIQKRIERIVSSLEMSAVKFLNIMTVHGLIEASQIKTVKVVSEPAPQSEPAAIKQSDQPSENKAPVQTVAPIATQQPVVSKPAPESTNNAPGASVAPAMSTAAVPAHTVQAQTVATPSMTQEPIGTQQASGVHQPAVMAQTPMPAPHMNTAAPSIDQNHAPTQGQMQGQMQSQMQSQMPSAPAPVQQAPAQQYMQAPQQYQPETGMHTGNVQSTSNMQTTQLPNGGPLGGTT